MSSDSIAIEPGRPIVLRRGTVLTMNDANDVHYVCWSGSAWATGKLCKAGLDPGLGTLRLIWNAIAERDVPSGAREHDCPRAPDQSGSDDRHLRHSRSSMSLSCRLDRRYRMCCDRTRIALLSFVTEL